VIRALIVAASARARRALESMLSTQGIEVVGSFPTMEGAAEVSEENEPDVLLLETADDSDMLLGSLKESGMGRETPALLLGNLPREDLSRALRLGIRGILPVEAPADSLALALEAVSRGLVVLDPRETGIVPAAMGAESAGDLPEPLTPREKEVLRLLAAGLGNKEIAARLNISGHTAKFHVASILGKLGASSRTEAVSIGMRRGLILL